MRRRRWIALAVALASGALALLALELLVRANRERFGVTRSEIWSLRALVVNGQSRFRPTAYVGWTFDPTRPEVNASGFLGPECPRARSPGVPRIACLGGSTTAGSLYNGYLQSYPGALAQVLTETLAHPVEVLNFGMPGWTSAESLVNWDLNVQDYRPDVVVIHHAANDVMPRLAPGFRPDYTHYTHPWRDKSFSMPERLLVRWSDLYCVLRLHRFDFDLASRIAIAEEELPDPLPQLVPATAEPFRRNLLTLGSRAAALGAVPVLMTLPWDPSRALTPLDEKRIEGMLQHNALARTLAAEQGWPLFDLAVSEDGELRASFVDLVHLSSAGYHRKAELLADFLLERGLVGPAGRDPRR